MLLISVDAWRRKEKAMLFELLAWRSTKYTGGQPQGREGGSRERVRNSKSGKEYLGFSLASQRKGHGLERGGVGVGTHQTSWQPLGSLQGL